MNDLLIKGGTVIDGTGAAGRTADVVVNGGRITSIGRSTEAARQVVDADGLVVSPGFVDIHTHYDAQVFWDTTLSPSPLHGVTTVISGNCGFTIAPLEPEHGEYLMKMLARVEGMPLESLEHGVPWNWRSFGEYLDAIDGTLMPNAGFLVGHCPIRKIAMGDRAIGHEATLDELEHMKRLLRESIAAGGLGFSSTWAKSHNDANGDPVPSRHASTEELIALCSVVGEFPGTAGIEFIPTVGKFDDSIDKLMSDMSVAANRPVNWNVVFPTGRQRPAIDRKLAASDYAARHGGKVIALTGPAPVETRLNFESGFVLDILDGWAGPMTLPNDEKKALLSDPVQRAALNEKAQNSSTFRGLARWERIRVGEVWLDKHRHLEGRTIGEIAAEKGQEPFDALCELVVADELKTGLYPLPGGTDEDSWKYRGELWHDDRTVIGASDAGAHLDLLATFNYSTSLLQSARERDIIELPEAIRQLTDVPASLYGITERGRLQEGWHADITVFDAAAVEPSPTEVKEDLPGGAWRIYGQAEGINHVFVNGTQVVEGKEFAEARPGTLLRAGRDTHGAPIK
ncbi:MAG: amidohydrolase family protein [Chromatiales bacterium]|jgi:N-acyl-D-aspartate/D-glutamate deacylase|nr:amidohydrolase family protein [Chromatiales bacterium]